MTYLSWAKLATCRMYDDTINREHMNDKLKMFLKIQASFK